LPAGQAVHPAATAPVPIEAIRGKPTRRDEWAAAHTVWAAVRGAPGRALLCFVIMSLQSSFYNAFGFGNVHVLTAHFGVPSDRIAEFLLPLLLGNFLGPILLGRLVEHELLGRRGVMALSFLTAGALLGIITMVFQVAGETARGGLGAGLFVLAWTAVFFFASTGTSTAYVALGEMFPPRIRARAFAAVFCLSMLPGIGSEVVFGKIVEHRTFDAILGAYGVAAVLMVAVAIAVRPYRILDVLRVGFGLVSVGIARGFRVHPRPADPVREVPGQASSMPTGTSSDRPGGVRDRARSDRGSDRDWTRIPEWLLEECRGVKLKECER